MFNDNKLKDVSNAVSKIMEASMKEELKGNQHKIDANKNNKIDAHDFKLLRSGKKVAREEVESVEEGIEDRIAAAKAKAKAAGKPMKSPAAAEKSRTTQVAGKAYGGAAQKDEPEDDDDDTMKKKTKGSFKRRYNTKMYKEQFSGLLDSYINDGLQGLMENLEVVEVEEEVDNATFTKEVEAQKEKNAGRGKKADVAAASVQAVRNEEVEHLDEAISTAQMGHAGKTTIKHIKNPTVTQRMAAHDVKPGVAGYRDRIDLLKSAKAQGNMKEDDDQVDERALSGTEMKKREEVVKSMKKNLSGFKDRYGKRGKEVMYATATKVAKGEK